MRQAKYYFIPEEVDDKELKEGLVCERSKGKTITTRGPQALPGHWLYSEEQASPLLYN
ncbi:unnamed protein product [marine sediment metagenome]|uniref:Uncharacterized protein n=1 Tax=marine sediment metagenome TaxID=412755 RepID=X1NIA0_9ZZZZ